MKCRDSGENSSETDGGALGERSLEVSSALLGNEVMLETARNQKQSILQYHEPIAIGQALGEQPRPEW